MDGAKKTILCVDDEKDILDSLYDTFMNIYDVKKASSGAEALQIFNKEDVALVISDQRMPEMEGAALLEKINRLKPECKKILLTGYADIIAAVNAINKGAVDKYIIKPWDDAALIETAEGLIRKYDHDIYMAKLLGEDRAIRETMKRTHCRLDLLESYETFLKSCLCGVCVVSDDNTISLINRAGLEMMKYRDPIEVLGKDCDTVFSLSNEIKSFFLSNYQDQQHVFKALHFKRGDGSIITMQITLIFSGEAENVKFLGIIFQ